jgi:hypothetical protein
MKTVTKHQMHYVERQTFRQEPHCYDGETCDQHRPRWMTSYPKEGDEEDGETLKLEIPATSMPPGSRVTIEVPCCPSCGDPADMNVGTGETPSHREWPACRCGFSWKNWVEENFA